MKKFKVKITNEREIIMNIEANDIKCVKMLIEDNQWQYYLEDDNKIKVNIEASKGFKVNDKKWKIKSIKEI